MPRIHKSLLLLVEAALIVCLAADCATPPAAAPKPNFVVIVADDMGFSDAGCYGGEIQTPNLHRLADNGLRFTQFYNTARCWSSRACLLTGFYAQQVRRDALPGIGGGVNGKRPAWAALLPAMLRSAGYRSYHSGKWHVDGPVLAGGFDHSYCVTDFDRHFNPKEHALDEHPDKVKELEEAWMRHTEEFRALATQDRPPGQAAKNDDEPKYQPD